MYVNKFEKVLRKLSAFLIQWSGVIVFQIALIGSAFATQQVSPHLMDVTKNFKIKYTIEDQLDTYYRLEPGHSLHKVIEEHGFDAILIEHNISLDNICRADVEKTVTPVISFEGASDSFDFVRGDTLRREYFALEYNYGMAAKTNVVTDPGGFVMTNTTRPIIRGKETTVTFTQPYLMPSQLSNMVEGEFKGFCVHSSPDELSSLKVRLFVSGENTWLEVVRLNGNSDNKLYQAPLFSGMGRSLWEKLVQRNGAIIKAYTGPFERSHSSYPKVYGLWFLRPPRNHAYYEYSGYARNLIDNIQLHLQDEPELVFTKPHIWSYEFAGQDWVNQIHSPRMLADVNGDKHSDIVGFDYEHNSVFVALAKTGVSEGFEPAKVWLSGFGFDWTDNNQQPLRLGDVNGDGKADLVYFSSHGVQVALANSANNGFEQPIHCLSDYGVFTPYHDYGENYYPRRIADVNGDNRMDIVVFGWHGVGVRLAKQTGDIGTEDCFEKQTDWIRDFHPSRHAHKNWFPNQSHPRMMADVNGDGFDDIVGFWKDGTYVALSDGKSSFQSKQKWSDHLGTDTQSGGWISFDQYPRVLADVNGDGRTDIVGFASDYVRVYLSTGESFEQNPFFDLDAFTENLGWLSYDTHLRLVGDVQGTGISSIVGFWPKSHEDVERPDQSDTIASPFNGITGWVEVSRAIVAGTR